MYRRLIRWSLLLCLFLCAAGIVRAEGEPQPIPLNHGDLVAFCGDSITQQNLYTRYTELLLDTTFPDAKLRFVNVGWGGRHAAHIIDPVVLQRDLLRLHPDVVLINFGMNDGWYRSPLDPTAFTAYQINMSTLVDRIKAALPKARVVLLTPTICDPTRSSNFNGYNNTLLTLGNFVRELAGRNHIPCIDLFAPMMAVYKAARASDPKFTMNPDGVHPDPIGHWIIAQTIAAAFGVPPGPMVNLGVDAATQQVTQAEGAGIYEIGVADGSLNFMAYSSYTPYSLPLEARAALKLPQVEKRCAKGILTVANLSPDDLFGVYLNDRLIGRVTGGMLQAGIAWTNIPGEDPLTERLMRLSTAKFNFRWTAWRADGTGLATQRPDDTDQAAWKQMDDALTAMTANADRLIFRAIDEARTLRWRITAETSLPLTQWETTGPYNYQSFDVVYDPEKPVPPKLSWTPIAANANGLVDLMTYYGSLYRNTAFFTRSRIYVPRAALLSFTVGAYGTLKVWVNGNLIIARDAVRDTPQPLDTAVTPLAAGWNTILLRETRGSKGWGFNAQAYLSGLTPEEMQEVRTQP